VLVHHDHHPRGVQPSEPVSVHRPASVPRPPKVH
jgi:hypothetical protein